MKHKKYHETEIHFVIMHNTKTGQFEIDYDGTQYWVRSLFQPNSQTWCCDCGEYIKDNSIAVYLTRTKLHKMFRSRNND